MNGEDLATMMVAAMDRMMQERDNTAGLDRAIETVVGTMGRFDGKDVSLPRGVPSGDANERCHRGKATQ